MYTYNTIHNDYDTNVVRVELNSSPPYRPHRKSSTVISRAASREPLQITSSTKAVNRSDTFTKHEKPQIYQHRSSISNSNNNNNSGIIRSETFVVKYHDDSSDEQRRGYNDGGDEDGHLEYGKADYSTFTRSKKKSANNHNGTSEKDDNSNYATYTRKEKEKRRGSTAEERSLYINTDTYRKMDKKRASLLSQESENLNVSTFTKASKPKRVESFIKKIEKNLWRRKDPKEPSPAPSSSHSTSDREGSTIKRSKNIFKDFMSSGKKATREVEIQCKMDEDKDYYGGIGTRKSSIQPPISDNKKSLRPLKASQRYENGNNQQRLTSIIKSSGDRSSRNNKQQRDYPYHESDNTNNNANKKSSTPAPIRVEIDLRNAHNSNGNNKINSNRSIDLNSKKPIGIASPLPQPKSVLKSGTAKSYENKKSEISRSYAAPTRLTVDNNFRREGSDRISFREYREQLRAKNESKKITDTSDDDLRRSYQQSFFVPM